MKLTNEEKRQKRQQKAIERQTIKATKIKKRAEFIIKHPRLKWLMRGFYTLLIVGILSAIVYVGWVGVKLYNFYDNTLQWTKISGPPLADQSPDLLYASSRDKKLQLKVTEQINDIWDSNEHKFKDGVTDESIASLISNYNKIKGNKYQLEEKYAEIMDFWQVNKSLNDLFKDVSRQSFKKEVTITDLILTINENFDIIKKYLINNPNHSQAKIYQNDLFMLADAATEYRNILEKFKTYFELSIEEKSLEKLVRGKPTTTKTPIIKVVTTYNEVEMVDLIADINNLNYKWSLIDDFIKVVVNKSKTSAKINSENQTKYEAYVSDKALNDEFNNYLTEYRKVETELKNTIVDLPNFIGKTETELKQWADVNDIKLIISYKDSTEAVGTVIKQSPSSSTYNKIVKGSLLKVDISDPISPQVRPYVDNSTSSSSSSSSSNASTSSSNSSNSSNSNTSTSSTSSSTSTSSSSSSR